MQFDAMASILVTVQATISTRNDDILLPQRECCRQRTILALFLAMLVLLFPALTHAESDAAVKQGQQVQAIVRLTANGELILGADERKTVKVPMKVHGRLRYDERYLQRLDGKDAPCSARFYHQAQADITVDGESSQISLGPSRRIVAVGGSDFALFSPQGPISRGDLELISVQANTAVVHQILPAGQLQRGQKWSPADSLIGILLGLDTITLNQVQCELTSTTDDEGIFQIQGKVEGTANGANSTIDVDGRCRFERRRRLITALDWKLAEQRAVGPAGPGFQLQARLQFKIAPIEPSLRLSDAQLQRLNLQAGGANTRLQFASRAGGYTLLHDRRWHVIDHQQDLAVLRLVDKGQLLGQCNISHLPPAVGDRADDLTKFRRVVEKALANHAGRIDEAAHAKSDLGHDILRIQASGSVRDVPIHWIYYFLTSESGQRVAIVFTVQDQHLARFGRIDHDLIANFAFNGLRDERSPQQDRSPQAGRPLHFRR